MGSTFIFFGGSGSSSSQFSRPFASQGAVDGCFNVGKNELDARVGDLVASWVFSILPPDIRSPPGVERAFEEVGVLVGAVLVVGVACACVEIALTVDGVPSAVGNCLGLSEAETRSGGLGLGMMPSLCNISVELLAM
jgi:hypothetical protein